MAWIEKPVSGNYQVAFRFEDQKYKKSLRTKDRRAAEARLQRVQELIQLVESGRIAVPEDIDPADFFLSDGATNLKPKSKAAPRTLRRLCEAFLASIPDGSMEASTIKGLEIHSRHLQRIFGASFPVRSMGVTDLQRYVDSRTKETGRRGRSVSPTTIRKELATLRLIWNWARTAEYFERPLPQNGIRFPKTVEKPRFQTYQEIESKVASGNLGEQEIADLWDCLFLTTAEIDQVLSTVRESARHPFIYPMFLFAAHTGARRSEMLRSQIGDIDFNGGTVTIRETKRVRGKLTTRAVPLSPTLKSVLTTWIKAEHPGGVHTFTLGTCVTSSKKKRLVPEPLTRDEAHDHFTTTLSNSKWATLRGWHVFRHSFCSNCAASGIDQRVINAWVGHQTEEMVKRYRHLVPNQQQKAIRQVFG